MSPRSLPHTAHATVFARLEGLGRTEAVAQRLGEAIKLGLLHEGEQLPSEAQLAAQLGVSTLTLRDALASLRDQGLLATKRGRGGGTSVAAGPDVTAAYLRERLRAMSLDELRDVGDMRMAIAGTAARLAASRAGAEEIARLRQHVNALLAAAGDVEYRRADGRFHVELAAAARSTRLTREEMVYQAAFGPLVSFALSDPGAVARAHGEHSAILDAVAAGDERRAAHAMERHIRSEQEQLIDLHRELAASSRRREDRDSGLNRNAVRLKALLHDHVEPLIDGVFASIEEVREELLAQLAQARRSGRKLHRDDLTHIRALARVHLTRHRGLMAGTGIVCAPGLLADAPRWLEWWCATADGGMRFLAVNLAPGDPASYDYELAAWYATPRASGARSVFGPYVDYSGTDDHILTLTVPVGDERGFAGVAGADIRVGQLEALLLPEFSAADGEVMLVNDDGRVILSTSTSCLPGSLLEERTRAWLDRARGSAVQQRDGTRLLRSRTLPWAVIQRTRRT